MFNILFSYAKPGVEGDLWERELRAVRTEQARFVPFNHRKLLGNVTYASAFQLDMDFRARNRGLVVLYRELERTLRKERIDCLFVTNDNPYHPDFLKTLDVYRAYHTTDDPGASYTRTFPYVHAFDHLFHCAIPYSPTQTLAAKLREVGARRVDFLPLGVFDFEIDPTKTSTSILEQRRDIDIVYVGSPFFAKKFDALLEVTRAFGNRLRMYGFWKAKHSTYLSMRAHRPLWVRSISLEERVRIYQRAKLGFNLHWDEYGLGNQRLYHLPGNGVMQVCDSTEYLGEIFDPEREVVPARTAREMVDRLRYYLDNDSEREAIALAGFNRVQRDYRLPTILGNLAERIGAAMRGD